MEDTLWVIAQLLYWLYHRVLILVLMEDTLWALSSVCNENLKQVLILVLMEDTLWVKKKNHCVKNYGLNPCFNGRYSLSSLDDLLAGEVLGVLILVLMEDTLWGNNLFFSYGYKKCLNPCFNGRYSLREGFDYNKQFIQRLNPCFNGRYSLSYNKQFIQLDWYVLILVLMEDTLWGTTTKYSRMVACLNPCFNGRYSLRINKQFKTNKN